MITKGLTKEEEAEFDEQFTQTRVNPIMHPEFIDFKEKPGVRKLKSHISKLLSKREREVLERFTYNLVKKYGKENKVSIGVEELSDYLDQQLKEKEN